MILSIQPKLSRIGSKPRYNERADILAAEAHHNNLNIWSLQIGHPPKKKYWIYSNNKIQLTSIKQLFKTQDQYWYKREFKKLIDEITKDPTITSIESIDNDLKVINWSIQKDYTTKKKASWKYTNNLDYKARSCIIKIITGWAPTMMRETSWYWWVYPEPNFRNCPNCILSNNINNLQIESMEHLLTCKSNTNKIDLNFKNYFKEDEIFLNNLLNNESKKKRTYLISPIYLYNEITKILELSRKNTKKINKIIKEIFSRKIINTYINTWLPRCKALELLENSTTMDNKKRRKLMKNKPPSDRPKLEDGITRIKKTIRNITNLNKFNQRINTLNMYGRLAGAELLNFS